MKRLLKNHWHIFLIVFFAFFLRFFRIETLTSFQGDQGRDLLAVRNIIVNRDLTLLGSPSTFGPFQGPLYYYLLLPGLFLFQLNPLGGLLTAVAFNIFGLVLLYVFCNRFFSKNTAIAASILYAVSPLMTELGRTLLNAYFGLPIFVGAFFVLIYVFIERKINYSFLLGFLVGNLIQLHYNFAPFFLFCLIIPFLFREFSKIKYYLLFISSFVLASVPQILFEVTHEFLNTKLLLQSLQTGKAAGSFSFSYISFFLSTLGFLLGWENAWYGGVVFLLGIVSLYKLRQRLKKKSQVVFDLLVMYFFFFLLIAIVSRVKLTFPAYHYYMSIFPLLFMFAAFVLSHQKKFIQTVLAGFFLIVSFYNLNLFRNHGFTMVEDWSMKSQQKIAKIVAADAKDKDNWNIASVVDGDTQALPFRYHLAVAGADNFLGVAEYPKTDILYLVTRDEKNKVFDYQVWEVASLQPFEITEEWEAEENINIFKIERL